MENQPYQEDEATLIDYIKVIYKYRWMIIILVFICMLSTGIFSLSQPKKYEASAAFFPMKMVEYHASQGGMQDIDVFSQRIPLGVDDLVISILESRKMADRIIEQLNLKNIWKAQLMSNARKALKGATKIAHEKNGLIGLSVKTKSAELSAKIANAYVDNLDYFNRELNIGAQRDIVQVIDRAAVPEERLPRGTVKKTLLAGIISSILATFLAFFLSFIQNTDLRKRLKEESGR